MNLLFTSLILFSLNSFRILCAENATNIIITTNTTNPKNITNAINTTNTVNLIKLKTTNTTKITNTTDLVSELEARRKAYPNRVRNVDIQIHQANMLDNDVDKCKNIVNETLSHEYGSRKTARLLKSELDDVFKDQKYRFSVVISSKLSNIIYQQLYSTWLSLTANGKHYLLIASHKAVKANKLSEAQLDRIEDWTAVYYITYDNYTKKERFQNVVKMLKDKLDLNYGKGNVWAVIVYKHSTDIRAKRLFEMTPQIQFKRPDGTYWLIFRGGENIAQVNKSHKKLIS